MEIRFCWVTDQVKRGLFDMWKSSGHTNSTNSHITNQKASTTIVGLSRHGTRCKSKIPQIENDFECALRRIVSVRGTSTQSHGRILLHGIDAN